MILTVYGCCSQNHIQLVLQDGVPLFFNQRDGPFMPTLKLLHQGAFINRVFSFMGSLMVLTICWASPPLAQLRT